MQLNPELIPRGEKAILTGLYLSKYDAEALRGLGFDSFTEAFNVLGYALGVRPGSIKNYRDEFDPLFDNPRKGWHKRPRRENCLRVFEDYSNLNIEFFTDLIRSFAGTGEAVAGGATEVCDDGETSHFAKRLMTGVAAERYFETNYRRVPEFQEFEATNTTRLGCGYDFQLQGESSEQFLAVEVKGLQGVSGGLSLTDKEHSKAIEMGERFYLFVVKNFRESPFHEVYRNPVNGCIPFSRSQRTVVQISWLANV